MKLFLLGWYSSLNVLKCSGWDHLYSAELELDPKHACNIGCTGHLWGFFLGVILQVSGGGRVNEEMMASVEFTNPFTFSLEEVYIRMEGPGVMPPKFKYYR